MNKVKPIKIVALGKYLPQTVTSQELETKYGLPAGWSMKYSGVENRHLATTEDNGLMGAKAAQQALDKAQLTLADIDMVISGGGTYDYPIPNQASIIKAILDTNHQYPVPAIDIDSTCLSFVTALDMAAHLLDGQAYQNILIVSTEIASKGINPANWETLTLFGDGAAAAIVSYDPNASACYFKGQHFTYSEGTYLTMIEGGGNKNFFKDHPYDPELHSFKMQGKQLLRLTRKKLPEFINRFFEDTPYTLQTVDAIVPHQASKLGLAVFSKQYELKAGVVKQTLHKYGNCIAASIPLTLLDAVEQGSIQRGDVCFLAGTSAGFSMGGILIRY